MEPARAQMEAQKAIFGAQWQRSQMQTEARQKAFGAVLGGLSSAAAASLGAPSVGGGGGGGGGASYIDTTSPIQPNTMNA